MRDSLKVRIFPRKATRILKGSSNVITRLTINTNVAKNSQKIAILSVITLYIPVKSNIPAVIAENGILVKSDFKSTKDHTAVRNHTNVALARSNLLS